MNSTAYRSERPLTAVITSIFENVQDIVRSEARLVTAEVREEVVGLTQGAAWLVAGIAMGLLLRRAFSWARGSSR